MTRCPQRREYGDPLLLASLLAARAEAAWLAGDLDRTASEASEGLCILPKPEPSGFGASSRCGCGGRRASA